jgi:hypothetical protein
VLAFIIGRKTREVKPLAEAGTKRYQIYDGDVINYLYSAFIDPQTDDSEEIGCS